MQFFIDLQDGNGPRAIDASRITLAQAVELMAPLGAEIKLVCRGRLDVPRHDPRSRDLITTLSMGDRFHADEVTITCEPGDLTEELLREPELEWNPNLFLRVDDVNWGDDNVATRIPKCFQNAGIKYVIHTLLVRNRTSSYGVELEHVPYAISNSISGRFRNYGPKCHHRVIETLTKLGINPNMDLTDFPWERLSNPQS